MIDHVISVIIEFLLLVLPIEEILVVLPLPYPLFDRFSRLLGYKLFLFQHLLFIEHVLLILNVVLYVNVVLDLVPVLLFFLFLDLLLDFLIVLWPHHQLLRQLVFHLSLMLKLNLVVELFFLNIIYYLFVQNFICFLVHSFSDPVLHLRLLDFLFLKDIFPFAVYVLLFLLLIIGMQINLPVIIIDLILIFEF